jgi:hypothetical protein
MDNIRRPMPVSVQHIVSLSNEEVDRIVLKRLKEIAHGITTIPSKEHRAETQIEYLGHVWDNAKTESEVMALNNVRGNTRLYELYISFLAYRLESALRMGPLKTPINSGAGLIDY